MASYNKIILIGNLTRDPQLSYLPNQTPVCEIGLACSRRYRTSDGQQKEEVCFVDCRAFGKQAETLNQYMKKGRQLLVEGRLTFDQWETQDGQKRSKHRVTISNFQFLDSGQGRGGGDDAAAGGYTRPAPAPSQGATSAPPPSQGAPSAPLPSQDATSAPPPSQDATSAPPPDAPGPDGEDIPF